MFTDFYLDFYSGPRICRTDEVRDFPRQNMTDTPKIVAAFATITAELENTIANF
jgi:hypothetical protein